MASLLTYEYVDKVPEDYYCSICTSILTDPVLVECCRQLFCEKCVKRWLQEHTTCPHCRKIDFNFIKDLRMKRMIDSSKIYCPNRSKGCEEITTVSECSTHLETCLFEEVSCTNDCGVITIRKKLQNHLAKHCLNRLINCLFCSEEGMYKNIVKDHLDTCPSFPLDCPNNCGHGLIESKDLLNHQKECPLEPVKCPFFEAGCKQEMPRKKLAAHKASNTKRHLELMMHTAQEKTDQLKEITQKYEDTQTKLELMTHTTQEKTDQLREATQKYEDTQKKFELMTHTTQAVADQLKEVTQKYEDAHEKLKVTQEEVKAIKHMANINLKQSSFNLHGLASFVTQQLSTVKSNSQNKMAISNITKGVEAATTMLERGKKYCLPLIQTTTRASSPVNMKSVSFHIKPGYEMYVNIKRNVHFIYRIMLLKSEHDNTLEWPMPAMDIELASMSNRHIRTVTTCRQCSNTVHRLKSDQTELEIGVLPHMFLTGDVIPPGQSILLAIKTHQSNCYSENLI